MADQQFKDYITSRTEDGSPDIANDLVVTYDNSAATSKKAKLQNLVGTVLAALRSAFVPASASAPASLDFHEDTDNGSHRIRVTAPASITANRSQELPDKDGTFAMTSDVDAAVAGLSWKQAVRVATTANGTLATGFENGDTVDGVTLATGDRILIKNQTTQTENGIYIVQASGAPVRATDADTGAELVNASCYVQQGTANADKQFVCTTNATITIGSTNITFVEFSSGSGISGSTGSTDNAIIRADGTGGATVQSSGAAVDDDGIVASPGINLGGDVGNSVPWSYGLMLALWGWKFTGTGYSQITSNQNNYSITGYLGSGLRLSSDASRNITGFVSPNSAVSLTYLVVNVGSNDIVLKHQDSNSTAGNRMILPGGTDLTLGADETAIMFYDPTTTRWRVFKL